MLKQCNSYTSLIVKNIDPNSFYFLLSNSFEINYVELKSIVDKPIHDNHIHDNHIHDSHIVDKSVGRPKVTLCQEGKFSNDNKDNIVTTGRNKWIEVKPKRVNQNLQPLFKSRKYEQSFTAESQQILAMYDHQQNDASQYVSTTYQRSSASVADNSDNWRSSTA